MSSLFQVSKDKNWLDTCLKEASTSIQKCLALLGGKYNSCYYTRKPTLRPVNDKDKFWLACWQWEPGNRTVYSAGILHHILGLGTDRSRAVVPAHQATQPDEIGSLESILGLLKV
jgi:hypothetical protein